MFHSHVLNKMKWNNENRVPIHESQRKCLNYPVSNVYWTWQNTTFTVYCRLLCSWWHAWNRKTSTYHWELFINTKQIHLSTSREQKTHTHMHMPTQTSAVDVQRQTTQLEIKEPLWSDICFSVCQTVEVRAKQTERKKEKSDDKEKGWNRGEDQSANEQNNRWRRAPRRKRSRTLREREGRRKREKAFLWSLLTLGKAPEITELEVPPPPSLQTDPDPPPLLD